MWLARRRRPLGGGSISAETNDREDDKERMPPQEFLEVDCPIQRKREGKDYRWE